MSGSRLVCGLQPVREAIRAHGQRLERVLVAAEARDPSPQLEALARFARDHGARVERPPRAELDRMTRGAQHQGTVAFAPELPMVSLGDWSWASRRWWSPSTRCRIRRTSERSFVPPWPWAPAR